MQYLPRAILAVCFSGLISTQVFAAINEAPPPPKKPDGLYSSPSVTPEPKEKSDVNALYPPRLSDKEVASCEAELKALNVDFQAIGEVKGEGSCGIAKGYAIRTLGKEIALSPEATLSCPAALAAARWVQTFVIPAAKTLGENAQLKGISQGSSYVCRNRNNAESGKLSEHAYGNALDITGFGFANHPAIAIMPRVRTGNREEAFQRAVRGTACLSFTTVIGPGSDEYHEDHLHLDVAARRGGYRLCQ